VVSEQEIDMAARIMSMGKLHHAMTGTGAIAIAVASAIPGTIVNIVLGGKSQAKVKFGHPSGTLGVGAEASNASGEWVITKALMSRSARRLMTGEVWVPEA
jgi:2-methylaconitate isomerase